MANPDNPNIYISSIPHKFPDRAIREAVRLQDQFNLNKIGVEVVPLRITHPEHLAYLVKDAQVKVSFAGVTTAKFTDYFHDISLFRKNTQVLKEIAMNMAAIGSQDEPGWTRVFVSHFDLAKVVGATYLAMHHEPTAMLERQGKLEKWSSSEVLYARKLGWGPQDNRPEPLSYDLHKIEEFVSRWKEWGANMGTLLPTDTALRTGADLPDESKRYNLETAWKVLKPSVIQVGDYNPDGKKEKLRPGNGLFKAEIAALIQESSRVNPNTIYTVEVALPEDVAPTIDFILENHRG